MSFASETKKELTQVEAEDTSLKAELSAIIRMNGSSRTKFNYYCNNISSVG